MQNHLPGLAPALLVDHARRGDRRAEGELVRRMTPAVRAFAARRLHGRASIDEFSQDVMLLFVEALRSGAVSMPERVGGFVLGICRNLVRDLAKQQGRRASLWEQYGSSLEHYVEPALHSATERSMHLEDCMSQLSQRARDVVWWSFAEEISTEQIATRLQLTEVNVRVLRHRTAQAIKDCLDKPLSWKVAG